MPLMQIQSEQIGDGGVRRDDLNTTTAGQAVIRKAVAGTGVTLSSTGTDAGTGDVTISVSSSLSGNYISNSGAETDTSGWSASGANFTIARTTTAGEVLKGTGSFELTANGSQAVNDYISTSFTLDLGDRNRLLKTGFYFKGTSNYDSGDMDIVFHDGTNEILPSITAVPGGEGYFEATWVSTSASSYTLRFKAKVTTAFSIAIDDVFVGPEALVRGAAIGPWEAFTPTFAGLGTVTGISMYKRRVGENLEIRGRFITGTPTAVAPTMTIGGVSINTTGASSFKTAFGYLNRLTSAAGYPSTDGVLNVAVYNGTASLVQFCYAISTGQFVNDTGSTIFGTGEEISIPSLVIPIDGWTSDVVLENSRVEYAYNSDTTNADNTSSFAYSIRGGLVPTVSTSAKKKRIRFQTPIQDADLVQLQFLDSATGAWVTGGDSRFGLIRRGDTATGITGATLLPVNSTDFDVNFQDQGCLASSILDTVSSWSTENSAGTRWRVIKCANPLAVETGSKGYLAATSSTKTPAGSGHWHQLTGNSLALDPGEWVLGGEVEFNSTGGTAWQVKMVKWSSANGGDSGSEPASLTTIQAGLGKRRLVTPDSDFDILQAPIVRVRLAVATTVYLVSYGGIAGTVSAGRVTTYLYAERIS